jgi:hypothetical protein
MTDPHDRSPRPARFSRRSALHAALAASVGLPWLETFAPREARAQQGGAPCFIAMFTPNGTIHENWAPRGGETDFSLSPILLPLEAHRGDLVIVDGLTQRGAGGDQHQRGIGGALTGSGLLPGNFGGMAAMPSGWAEGPSVDQRIGEAVGQGTPFRSLELGVQVGTADNYGRLSYRAGNQPLAPREDPAQLFDDLCGASLLPAAERERRRQRRASVLDFVRADLTEVASKVSLLDRQRLDEHFTYVREVEQRLDQLGNGSQCGALERPVPATPENDRFPAIGELELDLLALALSCGRTRVASLMWSRSVSNVRFTWLGIEEGHHQLSHRPDSDRTAQDKLTRINEWYATRLAGLIDRLKRLPEGGGTLFDRCLVLWCNEFGTGNTHSSARAPYVLAGRAGGALRTGRFLSYSGDLSHNDLLLSLLRIFGVNDESFGRPEWCKSPLSGLV